MYFYKLIFNIFLTFVVFGYTLAYAAPTSDIKPAPAKNQIKKSNPESAPSQNQVIMDSVSAAPVEPLSKSFADDSLIPTRPFSLHAWTMGGGLWVGAVDENNLNATSLYFSLMRTDYMLDERAYEYGFNITDTSRLGGHWDYVWLSGQGQGQELFYKAGVGALYIPIENIGTLINYRRYFARASIGLEDLFNKNRKYRADITGQVGLSGLYSIQLNFAYAFADW